MGSGLSACDVGKVAAPEPNFGAGGPVPESPCRARGKAHAHATAGKAKQSREVTGQGGLEGLLRELEERLTACAGCPRSLRSVSGTSWSEDEKSPFHENPFQEQRPSGSRHSLVKAVSTPRTGPTKSGARSTPSAVAGRQTHTRTIFESGDSRSINFHKDRLTGQEVFTATKREVLWFQFIAEHMWPFVVKAITKMLLEDIGKKIAEDNQDHFLLKTFKITKVEFGTKRPRFGPLTGRGSVSDRAVELSVMMHWDAEDSEVEVEVGGFHCGIKDIKLSGPIIIGLAPLLDVLPITGGLFITFPDFPELDFSWTGIGKALNLQMIKDAIRKASFEAMTLPNRWFLDIAAINLVPPEDRPPAVHFNMPDPLGVLRVEVFEATDLCRADTLGSSDPYVRFSVGCATHKTRVISNSLNPKWGEFHGFDFFVYDFEQRFFADVYDSDLAVDDFLGSVVKDPIKFRPGEALQRPCIQEVLQSPDKRWRLDTSSVEDGEDKDSQIHLRFSFRKVETTRDILTQRLIDCPEKHGLQTFPGSFGKMSCQLCGACLSRTWMQWARQRPGLGGMHCSKCKFGVCASCWVERRPACGQLRILLKSARVPGEDAEIGTVLSLEFEGQTLQSQRSHLPFDTKPNQWVEKSAIVNNLHWHANLDVCSIGMALQMSVDEVNHYLDDRKAKECPPHIPKSTFRNSDGSQEVVWDEAFHFLVRDPCPDHCVLKIVYSCTETTGSKRKIREIKADQMLCQNASPAVTKAGRRASQNAGEAALGFSYNAHWVLMGSQGEHLEIEADVCMYPLSDELGYD
eukprot:TRINITY_DN29071_c0_g1_i1.p1 TRINITY_DN29071_c0_g1~~TRINITY_DN29071_c0_g1_i1.p1  ORF type:complete len:799 (+),score=172.42 TRINITY_DN29071_c0_g1_i1:199-2595(+)